MREPKEAEKPAATGFENGEQIETNEGRTEPDRFRGTSGLGWTRVWFAYAVLASFVIIGNLRAIGDWKLTHWWFSYDFGFVKRGLMGTLLKPLSEPLGHVIAVNLVSVLILAVATAAIVTAASAFTVRQRGSLLAWLVSCALITMPGSIASLATDFGRYDGVLVLILVWSIWATWRIMERPRIPLVIAFVAIQAIGVLVHEIHLLVTGPAIAAVMLIRWERGQPLARALVGASIGATGLATAVVGSFGRVTTIGHDQLVNIAANELPFAPSSDTILVLTRSFVDNLEYAFNRWSTFDGVAALVSTAVALVPIAVVLFVLLRTPGIRYGPPIVAASATLLDLTVLAIDVGRWATFASLNGLLATMVAVDTHAEGNGMRIPARSLATLAYAALLGAVLGGMSITDGNRVVAEILRWVASLVTTN